MLIGIAVSTCYCRVMPHRSSLAILAATFVLSACAGNPGSYPSLALRPVERMGVSVSPPVADLPAPLDPEVLARLGVFVEQARRADERFKQREGRVHALITIAAGSPRGGEAWSVATTALSELQASRAEVMIALAELDQAYVRARTGGQNATAITAGRDRVGALLESEAQVIALLQNTLGD